MVEQFLLLKIYWNHYKRNLLIANIQQNWNYLTTLKSIDYFIAIKFDCILVKRGWAWSNQHEWQTPAFLKFALYPIILRWDEAISHHLLQEQTLQSTLLRYLHPTSKSGRQTTSDVSLALNMHRMRGCNLFSITFASEAHLHAKLSHYLRWCRGWLSFAFIDQLSGWSKTYTLCAFGAHRIKLGWEKSARPIEIKEGAVPPLPGT